ncbi:di-heme oxidoredictase family protein, partial [Flavobacterium psychrophilum]
MKKIFLSLFITILYSCDESYVAIPKDDEILDGPIDGLSTEESARFLKGDAAFNEVFTRETGLGSTFVATSCISCHAGDGKGHPFTTLTRFGQPNENGNIFLHLGGPQLQNRALPGFMPEQIPLGATFSKFTPPANTGLGFLQFITDADIL